MFRRKRLAAPVPQRTTLPAASRTAFSDRTLSASDVSAFARLDRKDREDARMGSLPRFAPRPF